MFRRIAMSHYYASAAIFLWALAFVLTKYALAAFTSPALGFLRCLIASIALACILIWKKMPLPSLLDIPKFFLSGILGLSLYLLIFNKGMETLTAATSCIIVATTPIMTALLASFILKEKLPQQAWIAIALEFTGILALTLWDGVLSINTGIFWTLAGSVLLSLYNILQREYTKQHSSLQITAYSFFTATITLLFFMPDAWRQMQAASPLFILAVIFLGVFCSGAAYLLWAKALSVAKTTSSVTNYMFVTPLLALLFGYVLIAELPGTGTFVGGSMIIGGLLLFNMATRQKLS